MNQKYSLISEIFNAITHGIATGLAITGLVFLILKGVASQSTLGTVSYIIYGVSLILLFLFSTLYHSLTFTKARKVMRIFDHSAIYVLIAGTYTPYCLLAIGGSFGIGLCIAIWIVAIIGIVFKCFTFGNLWLSTVLYLAMGWLSILIIVPLYHAIGLQGVLLLALGGISYSIGTIFYSMKKIPFMHVIWHLFIMLGAGFMYFSIFLYI